MSKQEFLNSLSEGLKGLPQNEITERLTFYGEMIDDMIEEGKTEQEAVLELGSPESIAAAIISETPITKIVKERVKQNRRFKAWEIALISAGFPVWLPILISALVVILSFYIVTWSVIASLWVDLAALTVCAVWGLVLGVTAIQGGLVLKGLVIIGLSIVLLGLCIFFYFGCKAVTKGIIILTKKIALWVKSLVIKGGKEK